MNGQRNTKHGQKKQKNTHKMPQMRKTLIPHQKKILRSMRLRKIKKNPKIQLAKQKTRRKQTSIKKNTQTENLIPKININKPINIRKHKGPIAQPGMSAALPIPQLEEWERRQLSPKIAEAAGNPQTTS